MAKITAQQLAVYAVDQLEAGTSSADVAQKLASYLLEERRSREMPAVMRAIDLQLAKRGSPQVVVTSAHSVSEQSKNQLAELLGLKNPVFTEVIDPDVIGGVKARAGESEIDLTVRARLNTFKSNIVKSGK
jgi:F0F1-type ATP synthase delta subunit